MLFLHQNPSGTLKLKKKSFENFPIFLTVYRGAVRQSAELSGQSKNIQALLKIGEN